MRYRMNRKLDDRYSASAPSKGRVLFGLLGLVLVLGGMFVFTAQAQPVPADEVLKGFQPNGDLILELDGEATDAELYFSDRAGAFLIMGPMLSSPVLVGTRTGVVETVHLMKIMRRPDGSIDLRADASLEALGRFTIEGTEVTFDLKGQAAKLRPRPDLLGSHERQTLREYKPSYSQIADSYQTRPAALAALRQVTGDVRVQIYFGSWCPTCGRLVPRMLRLDEDLDGTSKLSFDYYGLPRDMSSDPVAERDKIHGVPSGIVYVDGKEVARLSVQELNEPEVALQKILTK